MNGYGRSVLLTGDDAHTVFLFGDGASPEGDRPFLDAFDTYHKETARLFRSEAPYYEFPVIVLDKEARYIITERESVDEIPNYFMRDLAEGTARQLTFFPHPTPQLKGMQKELIRYKRADGVDLTATLYLPAGYDAERDGPLPMVMWAYPREFKSADAAGQVDDSPYRFDWIGWWSPRAVAHSGLLGARRTDDADHRGGRRRAERHLHRAARLERAGGRRRGRQARSRRPRTASP